MELNSENTNNIVENEIHIDENESKTDNDLNVNITFDDLSKMSSKKFSHNNSLRRFLICVAFYYFANKSFTAEDLCDIVKDRFYDKEQIQKLTMNTISLSLRSYVRQNVIKIIGRSPGKFNYSYNLYEFTKNYEKFKKTKNKIFAESELKVTLSDYQRQQAKIARLERELQEKNDEVNQMKIFIGNLKRKLYDLQQKGA